MWCSLWGFCLVFVSLSSSLPLLNGSGKTLHRFSASTFHAYPVGSCLLNRQPVSSTTHHHVVALLSDPARAAGQEFKGQPWCALGCIVLGMEK